eukprot:TRINITY_DN1761_c0_g1_i1.p1 TRINITY_DN1761_c0_g1~~TRINITY_DN1761_c0_g1_i1.p1  ORF type:complete len:847 (+),score=109.36 TRINITY_DN1761_c0_g1_i1:7212-9752(+)
MGETEIKNLSKIKVRNESEVSAVLKSGFHYRKALEKLNPTLSQRAHTIFSIRIEEPAVPPMEGKVVSKVFFVDLAGSERYGKGPRDNEKYREAMSIASDLKGLERAFLALPNEGILPKETILIAILRDLLQQQNNISLIGHITGNNFEESLYTLQYVERCKGEVVGGERGGTTETTGAGTDQMLRNLRQVNEEYKKEIENVERKNDAQLERIKVILGIDINLKTMLQRGPSQKERVLIENYKQAKERVRNFVGRNAELEAKLKKARSSVDKIKLKIDDKTFYFSKLLSGLNDELNKLIKESTRIKSEYNTIPIEMAEHIEGRRKEKVEEVMQELENNFNVLFSAQDLLEENNEAMIEATKGYVNCKRDIEKKYKEGMRRQKQTKIDEISNLISQYEYSINKRKQELQEFMQQAEEYCKKKKGYAKKMTEEIVLLRSIVEQQARVIDNADKGGYTEGILSVHIPKSDKIPLPPTTMKKPLVLNRRSSSMTEATFLKPQSRPVTCQKRRTSSRCFSRPATRCRGYYKTNCFQQHAYQCILIKQQYHKYYQNKQSSCNLTQSVNVQVQRQNYLLIELLHSSPSWYLVCVLKPQASKRKDLSDHVTATLKKIETVTKAGKDSGPSQELFPDVDLSGPPIVINAVETSSLTPTEAAYYFASTTTRTALSDKHANSVPKKLPVEPSPEEAKPAAMKQKYPQAPQGYKLKEGKRGKRKDPEQMDKSADEYASIGGELSAGPQKEDKGKNEEEEACMVCNREYEEGDKMIECDGACKRWYHIECVGVSQEEFDRLSKDKRGVWKCNYCLQGILPPMPSKCPVSKAAGTEVVRKRRKIGNKQRKVKMIGIDFIIK